MLKLMIRKELLSAIRNVRIQVAGVVLLILTILAVLLGHQGQQQVRDERAHLQAEMYGQWLDQGDKHPHSAAHYGQFAFKPKPALSFLDTGLDNFTGVSVFLEAHRQNEVLFSAAQDGEGMSRFGELTVGFVLQMLIPLLIIFLSFNIFSREREEGTLRLIRAQGLSMWRVLLGKVGGIYSLVLLLFIPTLLLSYLLLSQGSTTTGAYISSRFLGLTLTYGLYFLVFCLLAVLISAFSSSSRTSLLTLLGIWIALCVILPKASSNLADKLYPVPSQYAFRNGISDKVRNGIDGHNPSDERLDSLRRELLSQYGVESIDSLPVNWSGIAMQAGEEYTDRVYDQEFSKVEQIYKQQNRLSEWVGFLDPFLAMRNLSMALAGTDFEHHVLFVKSAEDYRRAFVKKMNKDMEVNHQPGVAYSDYKVGPEMWASVEAFTYQAPTTGKVFSYQWRSIAALSAWLIALLALSFFYAHKIKPL